METRISNEQLSLLSEFVARTTGLHYPAPRWPDLLRSIAAARAESGMEDSAEYLRQLMSAPPAKPQFDALVNHLTVGETYFFREPRSFEVLAGHLLGSFARSRRGDRRRLRIWSAACCTGEEAYSIAISLVQTIPDWREWNITVLATDINPHFLCKAEAGVFGPWSFRNTPAELKEQFFRAIANGRLEVVPEIKRLVNFTQLNLVEDEYPSQANHTDAMDVIFCRNVLMYFTPAQARKVIENLCRAQADDGWLVVSPSELALVKSPAYRAENFDGTILYQKRSCRPVELAAASAVADAMELPRGDAAKETIRSVAAPMPSPITLFHYSAEKLERIERPADPYAQAEALYAAGDYETAADLVGTLLSIRPNAPAILSLLAHSLANQGKLKEALHCCDQWIAADKLNPASHYLRSVILREQNSTLGAIESLRKAIYLDPRFVLAHFALGSISRGCGHVGEAGRHMANALQSLRSCRPTDLLPESDGITAGRLAEIIDSMNEAEVAA
jgi:chemotaxis protein methyltransferase CheR